MRLMSTNASASVSGSSSLSPKDHDYELVDSDLSEDVSLGNIRVWGKKEGGGEGTLRVQVVGYN